MKWAVFAAFLTIAATLWLPSEAAEPSAPTASGDTISFEQYRDWRLNLIERRQSELAIALAATDLAAGQKARLEHTKAYYDWLAELPVSDRDRRFRERFDRIDTNHDGQLDHAERAAWRDSRRAFYHHDRAQPPVAEAARPALKAAAK
jgi:hypothetical protein